MASRHPSDDHYYYRYLAFLLFMNSYLRPHIKIPTVTQFEKTTAIMTNNARYYYSLPTEAPRSRSGSRRPPLTPSTVSSPCLTTLMSMPRRDSASSSGSPTKAHALLAKVVSTPTTPRGENPPTPTSSSPTESRNNAYQSTSSYSYESPTMWRSESDRYVRQYRQQGKPPLLPESVPFGC